MTVSAFLTVSPGETKGKSSEIASAIKILDGYDLEYEVTPMGTLIETESSDELFDAVKEAHREVDSERVSTFLKIDDKRYTDEPMKEKLRSVKKHM